MSLELMQNKIFDLSGQRVILDFDLAEFYQRQTWYLKRAVGHNVRKFPVDFMIEQY